MQKPNVEAEVCNSNNCYNTIQYNTITVTEEKKKFKSLIRFHSANKINNNNREGKKEKKNPKESTEQVKV